MKKTITVFIIIAMALSFSTAAFAADKKASDPIVILLDVFSDQIQNDFASCDINLSNCEITRLRSDKYVLSGNTTDASNGATIGKFEYVFYFILSGSSYIFDTSITPQATHTITNSNYNSGGAQLSYDSSSGSTRMYYSLTAYRISPSAQMIGNGYYEFVGFSLIRTQITPM